MRDIFLRPNKKPLLAFTSGDPAGIGPRCVIGALRSSRFSRICRPLLVGEPSVWASAGWRPGLAPLVGTGLGVKPAPWGRATSQGGRASFASLRLALRLIARGHVLGLVTAPISKLAWSLAGIDCRDHTEYFKQEVRASDVQMALGVPKKKLWCVLATRHISLAQAPSELKVSDILSAAESLERAMRLLRVKHPRLGLCALNPHAGEEGLLGSEEKRILAPAVIKARRQGIRLAGPIAADTAWRWHQEGKLDALIALYHDQALIPLKMAGGLEVVNWTLGLPFVRTSPGHGTGFDIAGKGIADARPMIEAVRAAVRLGGRTV